MQYRTFGNLGFEVSILGFGAMRLPTQNEKIIEKEATKLIYYAIDHGVNYIDTAYLYHNGTSEEFLGRLLKGGLRQQIKLTSKLPCWLVKTNADFDIFLDTQLKRLQTDYLDFYLLHSLNAETWDRLLKLDVLSWAERARQTGRLRWFGFSFHDSYDIFIKILSAYPWDMCQIQYNYMDVENQAGQAGLREAFKRQIPVVVMEPLLGGKLAARPPHQIEEIWDRASLKRTPVAWALEWLWAQPEVTTVLSGMSSLQQVKENVALALRPRPLTAQDQAIVAEVRQAFRKLAAIPCTRCGYCMPCPQGVDIPANLNTYNDGLMYNSPEAARGTYQWWESAYFKLHVFERDIRASACSQCGLCETKCPQAIPISSWMPVIHKVLGEGEPYRKQV